MKHIIYKGLMIPVLVASLAACDENSWNDHLDGFEGDKTPVDVQTINYTLTPEDYKTISTLKANVALAGEAHANALKALGTQQCFTEEIPAADYLPAFFAYSGFPYFTLDNGSAIKVTYNEAEALPAEIAALGAAKDYTLTTEDYIAIWESDDNYIDGFAPSQNPARSIPGILAANITDAAAGAYAVATYAVATQEPIFGNVEEPDPDPYHGKTFAMVANGLAATALPEKTYGYLPVTPFEPGAGSSVALPDECKFLFETYGDGYSIKDCLGRYLYQTGTYNNISFSDSEPADGAIWYIEPQTDGTVQILNASVEKFIQYDPKYNSWGSYPDHRGDMPTLYDPAAKAPAKAPVVSVPTEVHNAVYRYDGSKWSAASGISVLQPADYTAMGQKYGNLSNNLPAELLPLYLAKTFPYASEGTAQYVLYRYYGADKTTTWRADQYIYDGSAWTLNKGVTKVTSQFVRNSGKWNFDPSVTLTLVPKESLATTYFQACVDWVYENIDVPLGSTSITSGVGYVTKYGNNEYYSGTSAYQGNVDLRGASAKNQYPAGYEGMTDDEVTALMKERFCKEVMPGGLARLHPDAVPVAGIDVIYTINFYTYTGATGGPYTIRFKVTAPATFEFIDCNWDE